VGGTRDCLENRTPMSATLVGDNRTRGTTHARKRVIGVAMKKAIIVIESVQSSPSENGKQEEGGGVVSRPNNKGGRGNLGEKAGADLEKSGEPFAQAASRRGERSSYTVLLGRTRRVGYFRKGNSFKNTADEVYLDKRATTHIKQHKFPIRGLTRIRPVKKGLLPETDKAPSQDETYNGAARGNYLLYADKTGKEETEENVFP